MFDYVAPMAEYFMHIQNDLAPRVRVAKVVHVEIGKEFSPRETTTASQHVLVVDDKPKNLELAMTLLNPDNFVTLASGYDEGLRLIKENRYDVVLSDCQMKPDTKNSPLSVESIVIGQTVPNGIFLIFHATKRGARVAIVTDADHHQN